MSISVPSSSNCIEGQVFIVSALEGDVEGQGIMTASASRSLVATDLKHFEIF